jgi:hypothetical protein
VTTARSWTSRSSHAHLVQVRRHRLEHGQRLGILQVKSELGVSAVPDPRRVLARHIKRRTMKDDKGMNLPEPSRRNFLKAGAAGAVLTLGAGCASMAHTQSVSSGDGYVTTRDGMLLHYIARGSGKPLVLIPGWAQTAAMFREQLSGLSSRYQVIALDMRGHGESAKPAGGYRIAQLAQDTHDALMAPLHLPGEPTKFNRLVTEFLG